MGRRAHPTQRLANTGLESKALPSLRGHGGTTEVWEPRVLSSKAKPCSQHCCVPRECLEPSQATHRLLRPGKAPQLLQDTQGQGKIPAHPGRMGKDPSSAQGDGEGPQLNPEGWRRTTAQPRGMEKDNSLAQGDRGGSQLIPRGCGRIPAHPSGVGKDPSSVHRAGKTFVPGHRGSVSVQAGAGCRALAALDPSHGAPNRCPGWCGAGMGAWGSGPLAGSSCLHVDQELPMVGLRHRAPIWQWPAPASPLPTKTSPKLIPKICQTPAGLRDVARSYGQGLSLVSLQ